MKRWKRYIVFLLMFFWFPASVCQAEETPEELKNLYARSAVLMDGDSGRVLFGKASEEVMPMASTTKIMTCILALELSDGEEICQVSGEAAAQPRVHLGMREGETYYLKDLLYSMMLESHNDSAVCVAEHVGGSVEEFARIMNRKAEEIGCQATYYVTPNGLDGEFEGQIHSTTAADLALVMRYCIRESEKSGEFLVITQTPQYSFQDTTGKRSFYCSNHNALLTMLDGALSGKTGFTGNAGYCYVGAVKRGEETLIVALLACGWPNNKSYKWSDTRKLIEYGFANYEKKVFDPGQLQFPAVEVLRGVESQVRVELEKAEKITLLMTPDEQIEAQITMDSVKEAPVNKGNRAGTVTCLLDDRVLLEVPLVYGADVDKITLGDCLQMVWKLFIKGI